MTDNNISLVSIGSHFNDDESARNLLEQLRWPDGPICPHCNSNKVFRLIPKATSKTHVRKGVLKCSSCRKQFTVTVGTIFEDSHIPLHKWLLAINLICSSKKGISAHQLHRSLDVTYKSAWFMAHRIRYAMSQSPLSDKLTGIIEADETYIGPKAHGKRGRGAEMKTPVFALVQRGGQVRSFKTDRVTAKNLQWKIREHVDKKSTIMTDDFLAYKGLNKSFAAHKTVNHSEKEYVNGDVHTNTVEGYFSILKRGITGIYQHVSNKHLSLYLDEFNFRYNYRHIPDAMRTIFAIGNTTGKRLMFR